MRRQGDRRGAGRRRQGHPDCRPRQRRQDEERGWHPLHRPHHQPRALCGDRRRQRLPAAGGRRPFGPGAHHAGADGRPPAQGNDRQEPDRPQLRNALAPAQKSKYEAPQAV